ncbi:MAG: helix-turn-helix transcriptional regulator [Nitrospirae bacterium]|nr:helix-turn-helix transcriptional regulator [Nitrospirota bacterium]
MDRISQVLSVYWDVPGRSLAANNRATVDQKDKIKALVGDRMQSLRKAKGLTQGELSERVGISDKYLSNVECGRENPTLDTLLGVAAALGVPIWEFFAIQEASLSDVDKVKTAQSLLKKAAPKDVDIVLRLLREIGIKP